LQEQVHAVTQAIGQDIVPRVIDGNLARVDALDGVEQGRSDGLVVGDDRGIDAQALRRGSVSPADNRYALAVAAENQRARPRQEGVAVDQRKHGIRIGLGLADKSQPEVHIPLGKYRGRLGDFLL
jgi:hypothetical protein